MGLRLWLITFVWLVPMLLAFQASLLLPLAVLPVAFLVDHFLVPLCVEADHRPAGFDTPRRRKV